MVDCRDHIIHDYCGQAAADWARTFESRRLEAVNERLGCGVTPESAIGRNGTSRAAAATAAAAAAVSVDRVIV